VATVLRVCLNSKSLIFTNVTIAKSRIRYFNHRVNGGKEEEAEETERKMMDNQRGLVN
jgi:hypothetical protein